MASSYWRDVIWQASGNSLAQVVGILGIPIMTRLYTPQDFAIQSLFIQLVTIGTAIVTWRYEYFVQLPRTRGNVRALNRLIAILGMVSIVVLSPILWLVREPLAQLMGTTALASWIVFVPITAVLISWALATQNNAQRFGDFKTSGLSELAGKITYVIAGIGGGVAHLGASGLIATTALGAIGKAAFIAIKRPAWGRHALHARLSRIRIVSTQYLKLGNSTVLAHLLSSLAITAPQIAIARLYGEMVLGQFALVLATIYLPSSLLGAAIGHVYYQRAALLHSQGKSFFELWLVTAYKLALIGLPVYGGISLVSSIAYPFVFGAQWELAGNLAMWMSIAAYGSFVSGPMDRTCLIVNAGFYSVVWGVFRFFSTFFVIALAYYFHFTPIQFTAALVLQMCIAYSIDLMMGRRFSQGHLGVFGSNTTVSAVK
jgi:teichuronic acid exporter